MFIYLLLQMKWIICCVVFSIVAVIALAIIIIVAISVSVARGNSGGGGNQRRSIMDHSFSYD